MREAGIKEKGRAKTERIPIKIVPREPLAKPAWIRVRAPAPNSRFHAIKHILREQNLHTVCEEASCPNIAECFGKGTATFMILGDICTRRCPFCDVAHGRPLAPDAEEPRHLAETISRLNLSYVVITSVDRDDLRDGGAQHFVDCIRAIRKVSPNTMLEILVPDFRGRAQLALEILAKAPPDVMNHNLETVPRLYRQARPGGDYAHSLDLLRQFKRLHPALPTKSGLMVGLDRKSTRLNSSHLGISYAVFCLKKKTPKATHTERVVYDATKYGSGAAGGGGITASDTRSGCSAFHADAPGDGGHGEHRASVPMT